MSALRRLVAAVGAGVLTTAAVPLVVPAGTAPAAVAAPAAASPVTLTVSDVSPTTPPIVRQGQPPTPVTFTLSVVNTTARTLSGVVVTGTRADPLETQTGLDAALRATTPKAPTDQLRADILDSTGALETVPVPALAPHGTQTVVFRTTIGRSDSTPKPGICQCRSLIYPIYFTASTLSSGVRMELAHAETYLPSFARPDAKSPPPAKTKVAWVWPLLDRPHRLKQYNLFTDDDLATEVGLVGRLTKLLDVLQRVADAGIPITVVADPDLIDSLAVMTTGYKIATPDGYVTGRYGALAAGWLAQLRGILAAHPNVELAFTPFADPAVEALSRNDLTWSATADSAAQQRISTVLGTTGNTDITWPDHERLSDTALGQVVESGTSTVIMRDLYLTNGTERTAAGTTAEGTASTVQPDALAPLQTGSGAVTVAVTSNPIEQLVSRIMPADAEHALPLLPQLVAQLAIRAENSFQRSHFVLITPPRNLTVGDPGVAVRTILETSRTTWSQPVSLRGAVAEAQGGGGSIRSVSHGTVRPWTADVSLPAPTIRAIRSVNRSMPVASDLFADPKDATDRFGDMNAALQRTEATALLTDRRTSVQYSELLQRYVQRIFAKVQFAKLYKGKNAVYTFASRDASLPVTVVNRLSSAVRIFVHVTSIDDEGGKSLTADPVRSRLLNPGQRVQLSVTLHLKRVGQIKVSVGLQNADHRSIGVDQRLLIRSTTLGTIGIVITVVAGIVLVLAVGMRLTRRALYRRRVKAAGTTAGTATT